MTKAKAAVAWLTITCCILSLLPKAVAATKQQPIDSRVLGQGITVKVPSDGQDSVLLPELTASAKTAPSRFEEVSTLRRARHHHGKTHTGLHAHLKSLSYTSLSNGTEVVADAAAVADAKSGNISWTDNTIGDAFTIGDTTSDALSNFEKQRVCALADIPLGAGTLCTLEVAGGFSYNDGGVSNHRDAITLGGFIYVGLKFKIVMVSLTIGLEGFFDISVTKPQALTSPLEFMEWTVKTAVKGIFDHSKLASYFLGSDDISTYIDQVYNGVVAAETLCAGNCPEPQQLSDSFAELFQNYIESMQMRCPTVNDIYALPGKPSSARWDKYDATEENGAQTAYCVTPKTPVGCLGSNNFKNFPCNLLPSVPDMTSTCPTTAQVTATPKAARWSKWDVGSQKNFVKLQAQDPKPSLKDINGGCGCGSKEPYQGAYGVDGTEYPCSPVRITSSFFNSSEAYSPSKEKAIKYARVFLDAATQALNSDTPKATYSGFLMGHFSLHFFGISFEFGSTNFFDHATLDCTQVDTSYYMQHVRTVVFPGVDQTSLKQAMVRLCSFMATGVLLPTNIREDEGTAFFPSKHKNSNMLNMLQQLVPEFFPKKGTDITSFFNHYAEEAIGISEILHKFGAKGGHVSTFHHAMTILSGEAENVKSELQQFLKKEQLSNAPKDTPQGCTYGISSLKGGVKLIAAVSAAGKGPSVCNSKGEALSVSFSQTEKLTKTREADEPCHLSAWSGIESTSAVRITLPDLTPETFFLGALSLVLEVEVDDDLSDLKVSVDIMRTKKKEKKGPNDRIYLSKGKAGKEASEEEEKEEKKEDDSCTSAQKKADILSDILKPTAQVAVAFVQNIIKLLDPAPDAGKKKSFLKAVIGPLLTDILNIGYYILQGIIDVEIKCLEKAAVKKFDIMKNLKKAGGSLLKSVAAKIENAAAEAIMKKAGVASILPKITEEESAGVKFVIESKKNKETGKRSTSLAVHYVEEKMNSVTMAEDSSGAGGGAYYYDTEDYTCLDIPV